MSEKRPGSVPAGSPSSSQEPRRLEKINSSESAERIIELEALYARFEQMHDLERLRSIQASSVEELRANTHREAAKRDLPDMVRLINHIERLPDVPEGEFLRLLRRHQLIQAAVGTFNSGRLDHSIREGWIKVP